MTSPQSPYPWRLAEIDALVDGGVANPSVDPAAVSRALTEAGYGPTLVNFIVPLLERFGSATFLNGALRVHPFAGDESCGLPNLVDWNRANGWRQYEPAKQSPTFYFLSNSFGELLGIPVSDSGELARDRIGILFPDQRVYREAGLSWSDFFTSVAQRPDLGGFFAKQPQHAWAAEQLRQTCAPWQCFSYKVPPALGGQPSADNLMIVGLVVHVSFSLQLLKQHQEGKLTPGASVPMVDLYDREGHLLDP